MKTIDLSLGTRWGGKKTDSCPHPDTISVRSAGVERVICNACGHVSFSYVGELTRTPGVSFAARAARRIT
jgi:hypothetical protein